MKKKLFLSLLVGAVALAGLSMSISAASKKQAPKVKAITTAPQTAVARPGVASKAIKAKVDKIVKTDAEWKEILSKSQYRILREKGTEVAFTGEYWNNKADGTYLCAGCGLELFDSDTKFKSGTGWPSFYQPAGDGHVGEIRDVTFGMTRTEIVCNRCGGHLGHVFNDGPQPTGLRYCVNSASLEFKAKDEAKVAKGGSKAEEK